MLSNVKRFPRYALRFIITTPLPLSCFKITILLLLDNFFITSLYLNGTLILQYFLQVFRNFVINLPDFAQVYGKYRG